jgi:inorganic pyrophosphatase
MRNYSDLPTFANSLVQLVIETPRGSLVKFSYEGQRNLFQYSHPLPAGLAFPYDWGFVPSTLGEDGDPLDGMVIHQGASPPGVIIKCQLLACLRVEQSEGGKTFRNDRFLFCPRKGEADCGTLAASTPPDRLKNDIEKFLQASVLDSDKALRFAGWQSAESALEAIKKGQEAFARKL